MARSPGQKRTQAEFYDRKYADLRRVIHKLEHPIFRFYDERLHRVAGFPDHVGRLLELGCGQGGDAVLLSEVADEVFGVDVSSEGVATARLVANEQLRHNVRFQVAAAEHLPFGDAVFDVVYCKDALHHVADPVRVVSEARRVLKPGGRFIAIEANPLSPQMAMIGLVFYSVDKGVFSNTRKRLMTLLREAGLREVRAVRTEYFPRAIAFYYVSPLSRICWLARSERTYEWLERGLDRLRVFAPFANYIVLTGGK